MESLSSEGIYFSHNQGKIDDITKLEREYQKLYEQALILKDNPISEEYQRNKRLRRANLERRKELIRG
jgi:hypothetical protein